MNNKIVSKVVTNVRANGLIYFATIAIIYMIYNVIITAKKSQIDPYCSSCSGHDSDCECDECQKKEYFSEYTGDKNNVGYISTNTHKCNQPVFRYGVPGAPTKPRVPYL